MGKEKRPFCCHQNFVPIGLSAPPLGYIHMVKHEKNVYKIGLQSNFFKPATNGQSDKGFPLTPKVCPQGVVCPCPLAIYMYIIITNVYKIRFWRDILKLATYGPIIICSNDDPRLTLTYFTARTNLVSSFYMGKTVRKSFNGRNLQQMTRVTNGLCLLAHLSRSSQSELIGWDSSRRPSVRACIHTFKHEYLRDQQADYNQILSEASLGWGKGCIRFWCRSGQNSGFHGNG